MGIPVYYGTSTHKVSQCTFVVPQNENLMQVNCSDICRQIDVIIRMVVGS